MLDGAPNRASGADAAVQRDRLREAGALQAIEHNPLTPTEIAMFEMFEREQWPFERRRAHILAQAKTPA